ncbi:protein artichoke-like [Sitodiplosis mosellana]|uniref:protein artichoke-like n=1 Tax=Sitodiplosis mosellana TaxID=263140 RepID=UPI0024441D51|nr:protein artichoke-like [Sitodiplosis mosellana]
MSHVGLTSVGYLHSKCLHLNVFNVSFNEFREIPHRLTSKMPNVTVVDISHNDLEDLQLYNFWYNHKLTTLNISHNKLLTFYTWLPVNLRELDISNNRIKSISYGIFNGLNQFKVLNITNNPVRMNYNFLRILLSSFVTHTTMELVDEVELRRGEMFDDIEITIDIEDEIIFRIVRRENELIQSKRWFKHLHVFIFEYNKRDNTKALINLLGSSIRHVELTGSYVGEIDADKFEEFCHLKTLILSNTGLVSFSLRHITHITKLEFLDVSDNKLEEIGKSTFFSDADNLKKLCMQGNHITNMKKVLESLAPSMEYLNLKEMNLTNFDFVSIEHLDQLKELDISSNNLQRMYSMPILRNFYKLSKFLASDNNLENGGNLIQNLPSALVELDMSGNYVGEITANMFFTLRELQFLHLSRTNLTSFTFGAIEYLTKLYWLDISKNGLRKVNFALSSKDSKCRLNWLRLDENALTELDTLLPEQFPALGTLGITKNRFSCTYLEKFKTPWIQSRKFIIDFFDQGCFKQTDKIPTGDDKSSNVALYAVPFGVLMIIVVAAIVVYLILRRRRSKRSEVQTTVVYNQNGPANKFGFVNDAMATTSKLNVKEDPTDHIYEEIKENPIAYDQLRFNSNLKRMPIPIPMPFAQHTLNHYDNARLLRREYKS